MSYLELLCSFILHFCKCTKNLFSVVQMFCLVFRMYFFLRTIIKIIAYRVEPIFFNLFLVVLILCYIEVYVISKYFKTSYHKTRYQYVHVFKNNNSTAMGKLMLHGMWRISKRCFFQRILLTKLWKTGTAFWLIWKEQSFNPFLKKN